MLSYAFIEVAACDMCGAAPDSFKTLGLRLNCSQGLRPRSASGLAVTVRQCSVCGLIFADPQPVPAHFEDHYGSPEEYWGAEYFADEPGYFAAEITAAKRLLDFQPGMRALDVGAGIGKCMRALSAAGFDAWGLEPGAAFHKLAVERTGISSDRLVNSTIEDSDYPARSFDFVTFGAVLEHLGSPAAALERALGWLKDGGIIQAEVPSAEWLISRLVNLYYRALGTSFVTNISPMHPPFHLFEFRLRSFELHGLRVGYTVAEHHRSVCLIPHVPRIVHPPLRWWMERSGSGMQLTVYLRKTGQGAANC